MKTASLMRSSQYLVGCQHEAWSLKTNILCAQIRTKINIFVAKFNANSVDYTANNG